MRQNLPKFGPEDPSFVEAVSWVCGRLLSVSAAAFELVGETNLDGVMMERGVGFLALGLAFEVLRHVEQAARQES